MNPATASSCFPLFEFQDWTYQSMLVLPTATEDAAPAGVSVTAKKWAQGTLMLGQAFRKQDGYTVDGTLSFAPGVELTVSAEGSLAAEGSPASFKATGTGVDGKTKGAIYELTGWVFMDEPVSAGAARVKSIRGCVRAVRGVNAKPELELGGMPVGTVGLFEIVRANQ